MSKKTKSWNSAVSNLYNYTYNIYSCTNALVTNMDFSLKI